MELNFYHSVSRARHKKALALSIFFEKRARFIFLLTKKPIQWIKKVALEQHLK